MMVDKAAYIERLKLLYREKSQHDISDDDAYECFERLVALVAAITSHVQLREITIPHYGG